MGLCCLWLLLATVAWAESQGLLARRIGADDGLAQSSVFAVVQDLRGFIWIGTQDGLHRYDGERFTVYRPQAHGEGGLPHAMVLSLALGKDGSLWVGTFRGLSRFDPSRQLFETFEFTTDPRLLPTITALAVDDRGIVWVGTLSNGLWRLDPSSGAVAPWPEPSGDAALPHMSVWSLLPEPEGRLWVGTGGGLVLLTDDGRSAEVFRPRREDPFALPDARILSLLRDRRGDLWVGTGNGLARLDRAARHFRVWRHDAQVAESLAHPAVRGLLEDRRGDLWIGTGGGGLDRFDAATETFEHHRFRATDAGSLSHDEVWSLFEDRSGLLWVGTAYGGVNVVQTRPPFRRHRLVGDDPSSDRRANVVRALTVDSRGDLWIGTDGMGLFKAAGRHGAPVRWLGGPDDLRTGRIWHVYEDRRRRVWIGTDRGLHRWSDGRVTTFVFRPDQPQSLAMGGVRRILQDAAGDLWTAHFGGGLSRLDHSLLDTTGTPPFQTYRHRDDDAESLGNDLAFTLFEDDGRRLWIGTGEGLDLHLGDGRFAHYRNRRGDEESLAGSMVRSLLQDRKGRLWVGTDHGLGVLDDLSAPPERSVFRHLNQVQGLPNDTVYALLEDDEGRLWLSTNRGMARLDPATDHIVRFDPMDGLQGWEFNGGSAARGPDGEMYFGGIHGYNVFHPATVELRQFIPPVVFTGYRRDNERVALDTPLLHGSRVELGPDVAALSFEFAALDFADPAGNRYRYRLEGLNGGRWVELGERNEVTFTHLAPGDYRLEVQGSNSDGLWNETATELQLVVRPAWWQTWWAYLIYTLLALGILGVLLWQYWRRELLRQEINRVLRTSQQRLELALRGSGDGLWDWDIPSGRIYRSQVAEILGLRSAELAPNHESRRQRLHPDDFDRVEQAIQDHLEGRTPRYETEYRLRHQDGRWRWVLDRGVVVRRDKEGKPSRMAGTLKDITRLKEVESKLRLWATVFEGINEGVMITDTENIILAVNTAFCELTGLHHDDVVGRPTTVLETAEGSTELYEEIRRVLAEHGSWQGEVRQVRADGEDFLAWTDINPVVDETGRTTHFVFVVSDITQRKKSEEELRYLASYDVVTGLPNRGHFLQHLQQALADGSRNARPLAVLFSDLDHFKTVNDTLGHAVGDRLLQEAGRRLQGAVRRQDLVARLGGDEFTVLLMDVEGTEAVVQVAERILEAFAEPFELGDRTMSISTSVGISLSPQHGVDADELLDKADMAMYEAKGSGRNQYRFFGDALSGQSKGRLRARRTDWSGDGGEATVKDPVEPPER